MAVKTERESCHYVVRYWITACCLFFQWQLMQLVEISSFSRSHLLRQRQRFPPLANRLCLWHLQLVHSALVPSACLYWQLVLRLCCLAVLRGCKWHRCRQLLLNKKNVPQHLVCLRQYPVWAVTGNTYCYIMSLTIMDVLNGVCIN